MSVELAFPVSSGCKISLAVLVLPMLSGSLPSDTGLEQGAMSLPSDTGLEEGTMSLNETGLVTALQSNKGIFWISLDKLCLFHQGIIYLELQCRSRVDTQ